MVRTMLSPRPSLTLFSHLVSMPEAEIDLARAALVFAESEHPGIEIGYYVSVLDDLGAEAKRWLDAREGESLAERVHALLEWLYRMQGFHGNAEAYYDPRNSYLDDVLDRKKGIPISLAVVLMEVATRAGVSARGISFPGHFLVGIGEQKRLLVVDPFHGKLLGPSELDALHTRVSGSSEKFDPRRLEPCSNRQILIRMLTNLQHIHEKSGDDARLRSVLEHLAALTPSPEILAELERLGGQRALFWRSASGPSLN